MIVELIMCIVGIGIILLTFIAASYPTFVLSLNANWFTPGDVVWSPYDFSVKLMILDRKPVETDYRFDYEVMTYYNNMWSKFVYYVKRNA